MSALEEYLGALSNNLMECHQTAEFLEEYREISVEKRTLDLKNRVKKLDDKVRVLRWIVAINMFLTFLILNNNL